MDTCGLERVERFRIKLNEKNFASQKNTLTSSLPQRCRAVGTYGSGNDTLVTVSHVRAAAKMLSFPVGLFHPLQHAAATQALKMLSVVMGQSGFPPGNIHSAGRFQRQ